MDNEEKYINVMLMTEDKQLTLNIGFFGYTYEDIEKYMTSTFIENQEFFAQRWTQMKYT